MVLFLPASSRRGGKGGQQPLVLSPGGVGDGLGCAVGKYCSAKQIMGEINEAVFLVDT